MTIRCARVRPELDRALADVARVRPEPDRALAEVARVLAPGGVAVIYDVPRWFGQLEGGSSIDKAVSVAPFTSGGSAASLGRARCLWCIGRVFADTV